MKISKKIATISTILLAVFLTSCAETVVVSTGATAIFMMREKTVKHTQQDVVIATKMAAEFLKKGLKNPGNSVNIIVNEGRVLLTGIVREANKKQLASNLAWQISNVKEVIDEIQLFEGKTLRPRDFSKSLIDYLITSEIEMKLLFVQNVASINYKITTVNKTVYLIGVAQDKEENQKVLNIVAKISGVKKVVNHVILIDDNRRE
jgi:osmotically-inducible protein OsmY